MEYGYINGVTVEDAEELIGFAQSLREDVLEHLKLKHSGLL